MRAGEKPMDGLALSVMLAFLSSAARIAPASTTHAATTSAQRTAADGWCMVPPYSKPPYNRRMTRTVSGLAVAFTPSRVADLDTDLVVLPVFDGEDAAKSVPGLDEATGGAVNLAQTSG